MGQIIHFPQGACRPSGSGSEGAQKQPGPGGRRPSSRKGATAKHKAQLLFFTGVRYERIPAEPVRSLPSQRLYPPFPGMQ